METKPRVTTAIRLDPELHERLVTLGRIEERSINWLVNKAVRFWLLDQNV